MALPEVLPWPVAQLVRAPSPYTKVAGWILGQGAHSKQPVDASLSYQYISLSLSNQLVGGGEGKKEKKAIEKPRAKDTEL